jgi:hypothetical protein
MADSANQHGIPIYLNPNKFIESSEIKMNWVMQGSDEDYRCDSDNWIPLNGPGANGDYDGYYAPEPEGFDSIQGRCYTSRDLPVAETFSETNIPSNRMYVWSGSGKEDSCNNCAKSSDIPINSIALLFKELKIR